MSHSDKFSENSSFFLIVNPNSGTRNFSKSWQQIQDCLHSCHVHYSFALTEYSKHEVLLVEQAIKQGFRKIISVGGDGTLHHVVNGIMRQRYVKTSEITLGVIPLGTGNDWIKTYKIPNDPEKAIAILQKGQSTFQDVGLVQHSGNEEEYFVNLAGIGYDGYVVNKLNSLKRFGSIAYLLSGLYGLLFYKKSNYKIHINNELIHEKCLMVLFGICQYSGGGMQMTKEANPQDGLLDVTIAKNFSFWDLVINLPKLYNGKIVYHKKVNTYKVTTLEITETNDNQSFIEADGELLGKGSLQVSIVAKALQVIH